MVHVITVSGKQYCVTPGAKLVVDRINQEVGESISLADALSGKTITATIDGHQKGDKVISRKFRNKTRYYRVKGHRQSLTVISFAGDKTAAKPEEVKETA